MSNVGYAVEAAKARKDLGAGLRFRFAMILCKVEVVMVFGDVELHGSFMTQDRDGEEWSTLVMTERLPGYVWKDLTEESRRSLLRSVVQSWIAHEVDEGLTLDDGTRPWDPHKGGR